jgi:hypothetical protein
MTATASTETAKGLGIIERALRAFSSEKAQRAVATLEVTLPIPGVTSVISGINFIQHTCAACINARDGEFSRGIINACQALADVGQVLAGFLPIGETFIDIGAFGLEFADLLVDHYNDGARGKRPHLSPKMNPAINIA